MTHDSPPPPSAVTAPSDGPAEDLRTFKFAAGGTGLVTPPVAASVSPSAPVED